MGFVGSKVIGLEGTGRNLIMCSCNICLVDEFI